MLVQALDLPYTAGAQTEQQDGAQMELDVAAKFTPKVLKDWILHASYSPEAKYVKGEEGVEGKWEKWE